MARRFPAAGRCFRPARPAGPRRWQAPQGQDREGQGPQDQGRQGAWLRDQAREGEGLPDPHAAAGHPGRPAAWREAGHGEPAARTRPPTGGAGVFPALIEVPCGHFPGSCPHSGTHQAGDDAKVGWNARRADGPSASRATRAARRAGAVPGPPCPLRLSSTGPTDPAAGGEAARPRGGAAGIASCARRDPACADVPPSGHTHARAGAAVSSAEGTGRPPHSGPLPLFRRHDTRGRDRIAGASRCRGPAADPGGPPARAARGASRLLLLPAADAVGTAHRPSSPRPAAAPCGPCPAAA